MKLKQMVVIVVGLCLALPAAVCAKPVTINWWHAMRSARGKVVDTMIKKFNESQSEYVVVGTNKGNYDEVMNAGVADHDAVRSYLSRPRTDGKSRIRH